MKHSRSGISIIETVVALLILAAIGGALMALNVQIQSVANSAKFKNVAEVQAQKMIELARNKKNVGGVSALGVGCFKEDLDSVLASVETCDCEDLAVRSVDLEKGFKTCVRISGTGAGRQIQAYVFWTEKSKERKTEVDTYLYDY